ncbi:acyltransferase [Psychromonas sp. PT13]|uniref:acyltransferase n=1 Tax=Psychromonas sp. PT13 TaxID=3439547 RepID=UPI003EBD3D9E
MNKLINFIWRRLSKYVFPIFYKFTSNNIQIGSDVIFFGMPILDVNEKSNITLGDKVVLCSRNQNTALGVSKPVIIRTMQPKSVVTIGADTGVSGATICAMEKVTIGKECLLGSDVMIFDNDFHSLHPEGRRYAKDGVVVRPVNIADNVFIGARTIVMKGVTIGENSVIGAGSIVVSNIPANVIAAGNPCKVIKSLGCTIEK